MRIAAWNANYNRHRRSFERDAEFMWAERADLLVLSETAHPAAGTDDRTAWIGDEGGPGLGVIERNGYTLSAQKHSGAPALFGAFQVKGPRPPNLLAAWPVQTTRPPKSSYATLLKTALEVFGEFLCEERVALVGDLNSSSRVVAQAASHPKFIKEAAELGLTSLYHHRTKEAHGEKLLPTCRHSGPGKKGFHLEYCFLSPDLLTSAKIRVIQGADWEARSGHFPIIIDLD